MGDQPCQTLKLIVKSQQRRHWHMNRHKFKGDLVYRNKASEARRKREPVNYWCEDNWIAFQKKKKVGFTPPIECQNKFQKDQWFKCKTKSIKYWKKKEEIFLQSKEWVRAFSHSKSSIHKEKSNIFSQNLLCLSTPIGNVTRQIANWENT